MKIALIQSHPETESLSTSIEKSLLKAAKKQGHDLQVFNVFDYPIVNANPIKNGFPPEFATATDYMAIADLVICVGPMWNFGYPGMFKNFLDGIVQSKKMFHFVPDPFLTKMARWFKLEKLLPTAKPVGLMKAKKIICVWTADGPAWYYQIFWWKNILYLTIKTVFGYCGVTKFEQKILGMTRLRSQSEIQDWLDSLEKTSF